MLGEKFEQDIYNENCIRKMYRRRWSSTEDGPSYQENVRSNSRSDLMLSLDDGMRKKKELQDRANSGEQLGLRLSLIHE